MRPALTLPLLVAALVVAVALALAIGVGIYVGGSFLIMQRHVERRPLRATLADALREIGTALLIQPLLPLYYLIGRRMAGGSGTPIVVVHGYTQNRANFLLLARALSARGLGPIYGFNYAWAAPIGASAKRLDHFLAAVRLETGAPAVDLVAHSLGGLVVLELSRIRGAEAKIRRVVTIASPHAGAAWKGPVLGASGAQVRAGSSFLARLEEATLPSATLSIYSSHDNVVHPPATSSLAARGGRDLALVGGAHLAVLFDRRVHVAVAEFLAEP